MYINRECYNPDYYYNYFYANYLMNSGEVEKAKQLTNFRASGKDDAVDLTPPISMNLDKSLTYIGNDELVEVTPTSIRLRKRCLDPHERKRQAKQIETA